MKHSASPPAASAKNLPAWAMERFGPDHWVMFFVLWATALITGRALSGGPAIALGWSDLVGFAAAWCFFLMLRVFDEHKDYEIDLHNHPGRVLQSGRVGLSHLKALGVLAVLTQATASLSFDSWSLGPVSRWWLLVLFWSCLMAKEFFVGVWLEKRLILYALSHMIVMPMAMLWMAQMGAGQADLPLEIGLLAGLSFLSGAAFEVTRKTKGAEEERDSIDSYSKVLGPTAAAAAALFLLVGGSVLLGLLVLEVLGAAAHWGWFAGLVALLIAPATSLHLYKKEPTARARKLNEASVGMTMLGSYCLLIAAVLSATEAVHLG